MTEKTNKTLCSKGDRRLPDGRIRAIRQRFTDSRRKFKKFRNSFRNIPKYKYNAGPQVIWQNTHFMSMVLLRWGAK
jgi:hypothetical protein